MYMDKYIYEPVVAKHSKTKAKMPPYNQYKKKHKRIYAPLKAQHFMATFPKSLIGLLRAKRILKDIIYMFRII